jgi:hypothetical protein
MFITQLLVTKKFYMLPENRYLIAIYQLRQYSTPDDDPVRGRNMLRF